MKTNKIATIAAAGLLALTAAGCDSGPKIKSVKDLTGDGINDILMYVGAVEGAIRGNYLFVGQKDGSFIRTREDGDRSGKYFLADDGTRYFFDGQKYVASPKQN